MQVSECCTAVWFHEWRCQCISAWHTPMATIRKFCFWAVEGGERGRNHFDVIRTKRNPYFSAWYYWLYYWLFHADIFHLWKAEHLKSQGVLLCLSDCSNTKLGDRDWPWTVSCSIAKPEGSSINNSLLYAASGMGRTHDGMCCCCWLNCWAGWIEVGRAMPQL